MTPDAPRKSAVPKCSQVFPEQLASLPSTVPTAPPMGGREQVGKHPAERVDSASTVPEVFPIMRVPRTLRGEPAEVWVYVQPFQGERWLHVRWMRLGADGSTWEPTTRGATIPAVLIGDLVDVLHRARGEGVSGC